MNKKLFSLLIFSMAILISCAQTGNKHNKQKEKEMSYLKHTDWSRNANIYEVNIRQYTPEGTFEAFSKHLPRLKEMGVDILWIMPIHPVSELNRKGSLGSYYAVQDYTAVNPEFGNMNDFKELVDQAHSMGMKVIIDWVANHTGWDNVWTKEHPDFYEKDKNGNLISPFDWTDVISLDYNNYEMRESMIAALRFWLIETNIDGYRCDVAGMVPTDFWDDARGEMEKIKSVFMLAEDEDNPDLLRYAFDMNYSWKLHKLMNSIAKGEKNAKEIWANILWSGTTFPEDAYRMNFTTNHDENSWNGTIKERLGDAAQTMAVLAWTVPGMPLIYSGQEAGLNKRLEFFEKDTINWDNNKYYSFYTELNALKKNNIALNAGSYGGMLLQISEGQNPDIFAFSREKDGNQVVVILNLSNKPQKFIIEGGKLSGDYTNTFSKENIIIKENHKLDLKAWEYLVLVK